jgi:chaperonin GroES
VKIEKYINSKNITPDLDDTERVKIASRVCTDFEIDLASREDWESKLDAAMKIARQVVETKTFPWPDCANIKFPLITEACIQFAARAYPEIVKGDKVVHAKVTGADPTGDKTRRALRISNHMSYQLLEEMEEWEEDVDKLLHMLPAVGMLFKKTYFDSVLQRNVSRLILPKNLVVNQSTKSLKNAPRISEVIELYPNDIYEREEQGLFRKIKYTSNEDDDAPQVFIEQHRYWDLDGDGYQEPYIVTVHQNTGEMVRMTAGFDKETIFTTDAKSIHRIERVEYYTAFGFLPDPEGGFYHLGFGHLLLPLNETINTIINQLLDAGTAANAGGGFLGKGITMRGGTITLAPGEWKPVNFTGQDLKSNFFPNPAAPPSPVLFQLLGMITETARSLANMTTALQGESSGANEPATTFLARVDQGMKVYSAIYKRVYRSMKGEFKKLARLNRIYGDDEYYRSILDEDKIALRADYNEKDCDVVPVADPTASTDIVRMAKARALMEFKSQAPDANGHEIDRIYLTALNVPEQDKILPPEAKEQTPPPEMLKFQAEMEFKKRELDLKERELSLAEAEAQGKAELLRSQSILNIAKAEAAQAGPQMEYYKAQVDSLLEHIAQLTPKGDEHGPDGAGSNGGGTQGMAAAPDNGSISFDAPAGEAGSDGAMAPQLDLSGEYGAPDGAEGGIDRRLGHVDTVDEGMMP